jgi:opacity protein-like surface antigen
LKYGAAFCALLALGVATPAAAEDETASPAGDDWQVSFTPYLWVAGIKSDLEVPGESDVQIDRKFTDTFSSLKFAFMSALNVEHKNFVFFVDGNYISLRSSTEDIEAPEHLSGHVDTKALESTPLLGYKVIHNGSTSLELLGGARILSLKNDIHLELPTREVDFSNDRSSIAPVIATRLKTPLGGRWSATLYGDVGGMTDLKSTWQVLAAVNYRLGDHWSLAAGYRHLTLNMGKSKADADVRLSGPLLGVTYRF